MTIIVNPLLGIKVKLNAYTTWIYVNTAWAHVTHCNFKTKFCVNTKRQLGGLYFVL